MTSTLDVYLRMAPGEVASTREVSAGVHLDVDADAARRLTAELTEEVRKQLRSSRVAAEDDLMLVFSSDSDGVDYWISATQVASEVAAATVRCLAAHNDYPIDRKSLRELVQKLENGNV